MKKNWAASERGEGRTKTEAGQRWCQSKRTKFGDGETKFGKKRHLDDKKFKLDDGTKKGANGNA